MAIDNLLYAKITEAHSEACQLSRIKFSTILHGSSDSSSYFYVDKVDTNVGIRFFLLFLFKVYLGLTSRKCSLTRTSSFLHTLIRKISKLPVQLSCETHSFPEKAFTKLSAPAP